MRRRVGYDPINDSKPSGGEGAGVIVAIVLATLIAIGGLVVGIVAVTKPIADPIEVSEVRTGNLIVSGDFNRTNTKQFRYVNVFAPAPGQGNPLNVVLDAADLTTEQMLNISARLGGSETTFILSTKPDSNNQWPARVFTPTTELGGAGHPTLGTAWVIRNVILKDTMPSTIMINFVGNPPTTIGSGMISVEFEGPQMIPFATATGPPGLGHVEFGQKYDNPAGYQQIADIFYGGDTSKLIMDPLKPPQYVNAGLYPWVLVPVVDHAALAAAVSNVALEVASGEIWFLFSVGPHPTSGSGAAIEVRGFASFIGVPEDPATGSGGTNLAAYLAKYEILGSNVVDILVDQGYHIMPVPAPSLLAYRATSDPPGTDPISSQVGGVTLQRDWSNILGSADLLRIQVFG